MILAKQSRVRALQLTAKFLLCLSKGATPSLEDFKTFADLCWLQVPMKYRLDKADIAAIESRPWEEELK